MQVFYSSYIANIVFNAFLCYTAVVLNGVTVQAIRKALSLPKSLKTLLLNLAVSDLGVGLFCHPFYIAYHAMQLEQVADINPVYVKSFRIIRYLFFFASFFGIMALSVDRFLAVHLHLRYQELVTHERVVAMVISAWIFSAFLSFITLWIPTHIRSIMFAVIEFACLITTTLLYYKIYSTVRRHANQIQALETVQASQAGEFIPNVARLRKSAASTFYIYLAFLVCYLPGCCTLVVRIMYGSNTILKGISFYIATLVYLNSSLNPLIYCWRMRQIRYAVMDIMRKILPIHN